ncbi:MAG TPA: sigma-54 dependent transcriptional regulator [Gemmatimonadaceae bacterium]|nr:sigma-54 dependent transcriptional regulator [Gemmatimonadaceae bacterium]
MTAIADVRRLPIRLVTSQNDVLDRLLLGSSLKMQHLRELVRRFAPTQLPVLIQGPTGSGKGVVARAIHEVSGRVGPFVTANVAAFGDSLIESELFGHLKGAFTNATGRRAGLFLHANRGTAFLDEIHQLSPAAQPKLLRVTECGLIRPVGSDEEVKSDFRLLCAANVNIEKLVESGRFQEDLLGRLSRLVVRVPPLAERTEDIPELVQHFLHEMPGLGATSVSQGGLSALQEYHWPRNVRELASVLERAAVLGDDPIIGRAGVLAALCCEEPARGCADRQARAVDRRELIDKEEEDRHARIRRAFHESDGTAKGAAAMLGVSRPTLYRWLRELRMPTPQRGRIRDTTM